MELTITKTVSVDTIRLSARCSLNNIEKDIWFEIPAMHSALITTMADPFLLTMIFPAMEANQDIVINNHDVSFQLLQNIEELQLAWSRWKPKLYKKVKITASRIIDTQFQTHDAICCFTGGIDGAFVLHDNINDSSTGFRYNIKSFLYVHGFHIPWQDDASAEHLFSTLQMATKDMNLMGIKIKSNLREFADWHDQHGVALSACLTLFQEKFGVGLIGSSHPYSYLRFPWGSNVITDRLASTGRMSIVNYGSGYNRLEKIRHLITWSDFVRVLNVCTVDYISNCGRCEKCVRTKLGLLAAGASALHIFEKQNLTLWQVLNLVAYKQQEISDYKMIFKAGLATHKNTTTFLLLGISIVKQIILNRLVYLIGEDRLKTIRNKIKGRHRVKRSLNTPIELVTIT